MTETSIVTMRRNQWREHDLPSKSWGVIYILVYDSERGWWRVYVDTDSNAIAVELRDELKFGTIAQSQSPQEAAAELVRREVPVWDKWP